MGIRSASSMWRATCSFPTYKSDIYRDYIRGQVQDVDILKLKGHIVCRKIDHINVRGHKASSIMVPFWQSEVFPFHTDSSEIFCNFNATYGSVRSEDNFGFYKHSSPTFRCTEDGASTTQYWFGAHV